MKPLAERMAEREERRTAEASNSDHPETMTDINANQEPGAGSGGTSPNKPASNKGGGKADPGGSKSGGAGWDANK